MFVGNEPGHGMKLYVQSAEESKPHAISPEGVSTTFVLTASGDLVADVGPDRHIYTYPINGGEPRLVPGVQSDEVPTAWSADGRSLFVFRYGEIPARVVQIDVASGQRRPWKDLDPADAAGIDTIS